MENLINLESLRTIAEQKQVFFENDGTNKDIKKVCSTIISYYLDLNINQIDNIFFNDFDYEDGTLFFDFDIDDNFYRFDFDDYFLNSEEPEQWAENMINNYIIEKAGYLSIDDNHIEQNKNEMKTILNNENNIKNYIIFIFNFYLLLIDIFENGDKNNIFDENENFINYCLLYNIND